jgi:hypothetical protein
MTPSEYRPAFSKLADCYYNYQKLINYCFFNNCNLDHPAEVQQINAAAISLRRALKDYLESKPSKRDLRSSLKTFEQMPFILNEIVRYIIEQPLTKKDKTHLLRASDRLLFNLDNSDYALLVANTIAQAVEHEEI